MTSVCDLSLRELYARLDAAWEAFVNTPGEDRRAFANGSYPEGSDAERYHVEMKELRQAISAKECDFEADLRTALGERMRADLALADAVYAALCNVSWEHDDGSRYDCSWRSAGGLVNAIVNPDDTDPMGYCNFYCNGNEGHVSADVSSALAPLGWHVLEARGA